MFSLGMVVFKDYDLVKNLIWNESISATMYGFFEFINFALILTILIILGLKEDGGTLLFFLGSLLFCNCVFFVLACFSKYVLKNESEEGGSLTMYEMYKNSIVLGFIFGDRVFPESLYFSDELKDKMCFNLGKRFALISTYCFAYQEYMFAGMAMTMRFFHFQL